MINTVMESVRRTVAKGDTVASLLTVLVILNATLLVALGIIAATKGVH